jgi:hypothetical protein
MAKLKLLKSGHWAGPGWQTRLAWVPAAAGAIAVGVAAIAVIWYDGQAVASGVHRNLVAGVWLAHARDLRDGIFYRALVGPAGYGGTRYFPLFFSIIGGFMRAGAAPLSAAAMGAMLSAVVLATGLWRVARALGTTRLFACVVVAAGVAPYLVQRTLCEIRCDVLAAGLNLWGVALALPASRGQVPRRLPVMATAACFTLAFATKVTSLSVPAAAVLALWLSGRSTVARQLGVAVIAGTVLVVAGTDIASGGHALAAWRVCWFAESSAWQTVRLWLSGSFISAVVYSHLLRALCLLDGCALVLAVGAWAKPAAQEAVQRADAHRAESARLVVLLLAGVTASTAFALSSPGTVANQVVEWIEVSVVLLTWAACAPKPVASRAARAALGLFTVWAACQDGIQARDLSRQSASADAHVPAGQMTIDIVKASPGPVFAESPLWPVLAGQRAYVIDPFALRVVTAARPDVLADVVAKLDARAFDKVILEQDPATRTGEAWYAYLHLGRPILARILADYEPDQRLPGGGVVLVPRRMPDRR